MMIYGVQVKYWLPSDPKWRLMHPGPAVISLELNPVKNFK